MLRNLIISIMVLGTSLFGIDSFKEVEKNLNSNILVEHEQSMIKEFKEKKSEEYDLFVTFFIQEGVSIKDGYINNCHVNNKLIHSNDYTLMINQDDYEFEILYKNVSLNFEVAETDENYTVVNYCFLDTKSWEDYRTLMGLLNK